MLATTVLSVNINLMDGLRATGCETCVYFFLLDGHFVPELCVIEVKCSTLFSDKLM